MIRSRKQFDLAVAAVSVLLVVAGFLIALFLYGGYVGRQLHEQVITAFSTMTERSPGDDSSREGEDDQGGGGPLEPNVGGTLKPLLVGRRSLGFVHSVIVLDPDQPAQRFDGVGADVVSTTLQGDEVRFSDARGGAIDPAIQAFLASGGPVEGRVTGGGFDGERFVGMAVDGVAIVAVFDTQGFRRAVSRAILPLAIVGAVVATLVGTLSVVLVGGLLRRYESELERSNHQLESANDELKAVNSRRQEMVHILSHDIVNPIGNIKGVLSLAADDPDVYRQMEDVLVFSVDQALAITTLVRRLQQLELGKAGIELAPVDVSVAVAHSVESVRRRAEEKGVVIDTDVPPIVARAEATSLVTSVLNNLLTNAIKFSHRGGRIVVRACGEHDPARGETVRLVVEDWGVGMPPSLVDRLFDVTARTSRPGTANEQGTGFGMPLVERFVVAYGGTITPTTQEADGPGPVGHRGTRFDIVLVAAQAVQSEGNGTGG